MSFYVIFDLDASLLTLFTAESRDFGLFLLGRDKPALTRTLEA